MNKLLDALARLPGYKAPALGLPPRSATTGSGSLAAAKAGLTYPPADFQQIASDCLQARQSLATGGVGDSRDLWWRLITLSVCCDNGQHWAHEIGKKDPRYTQAETDREYNRALADKQRKGLGAPKCPTFNADRPGVCAKCRHFNTITSPWQLGLVAAATNPNDLPPNFQYNGSWIEGIGADKKGRKIIEGAIVNPVLDYIDGSIRFTFDYLSPDNRKFTVTTRNLELDDRSIKRTLAEQGINLFPSRARAACRLILAWVDKLRREMRVRSDPPPVFGWYRGPNNKYLGFAAGGTCYLTGGGEETVRGEDPTKLKYYEPVGTLAGWQKVATFVAANVPELHTAIAASFGAPLMEFTGEAAGTISFVGKTSIGKTSAFKVGATVWGDFLQTTLQLHDTPTYKNLMTSMARSLPIYWDEVKVTDPDLLVKELHVLTQGRDKGRGTADVKSRTPGQWNTLSILSSNDSLCDVVADKCGYNDPTFLRMLEVEITRGSVAYNVDAGPLVKTLDWNYGVVGRQYARYIADNVPRIQDAIKLTRTYIAQKTAALDNEERFYLAVASAVLVGAAIATKLGILNLDRAGIEKVLCDAIIKARTVRHGYTPPVPNERLGKLLDEFLRDHGQEMVVTRSMAGRGVQSTAALRSQSFLVRSPPGIMPKTGSLAYHMSIDDQWLRISKDHWRIWARKKQLSPSGLYSEMSKLWGLRESRGMLGGGTIHSHRTYYYELSLNHPDLINILDEYNSTTGSAPAKIVPLRP